MEAKELLKLIEQSPINMFAVKNVKDMLAKNGYKELDEHQLNNIKKGDKVFFVRNETSLIALNVGKDIKQEKYPFHIVASHSDSPCFKIKPVSDSKGGMYNKINVEPYGGLIAPSWIDRPLSIAGRVLIDSDNKLENRLINIDRDLLLIPNLCIHFNREINKGHEYNMAVDMQAFIAQELDGDVLKDLLAKELNIKKEQIKSFDLYLYNRDKGHTFGLNDEFILSPRLDDLECVFTSAAGFVDAENDKAINVLYIADNEEVGSSSRQGADSDFLANILKKCANCLGFDENSYFSALANSMLVSADNAHAVHPNFPQFYDSDNKSYMNKGIVIKSNASQSYTTDAVSSAIFQKICDKAQVPYQFFTNKSDVRGGSTLGNILLNHVSLLSIDIGLAQLAMHSANESAGSKDVEYAYLAFKEFYKSEIEFDQNNILIK